MLFNSLDFAVFLPIVFVLYWFVLKNNLKAQNVLIVVASYIFYGWWDWRFLFLIAFSTILDFLIGRKLAKEEHLQKRKVLLWCSIFVNLGFLGFFKYYNFFLDNFVSAFSFFGNEIQANSLNIILPVGISFYTFQTLSYTIDVYRKKLEPSKDFMAFTAFVSFFPQLVAGPIERATNLLPQFYKKRTFNYNLAVDGLRQILWGLFKKIVIADNCATYANLIFNNSDDYSGSTLVLGALFFTFQIYGDFSGYSDIAIGTSRLFGFDLKQNFAFPYFSRDIAEFWRRWHISLSSWFKDYVYIPLGGSKGGTAMKVRNTFIIFIVSGFWHGANWTFIVWGALNAIYFLPLLLTNKNRNNMEVVANHSFLPNIKETFQMLLTFALTMLAWVFFRADNVGHALNIISEIFSKSILSTPNFEGFTKSLIVILMILFFLSIEWLGRKGLFALEKIDIIKYKPLRWVFYLILIVGIIIFGGDQQGFIYFQF
ncbi:MBOAT family O-acyltransferase [Mariniflexile litorale]|uniref:MBOAT family O-acyltransferase n=1 Tax=Mariniflexile litorale TaxID=3045158 RepID=A0AAU7EEC3_9FLAO|nr:MBOAT family O-acyltransferase [Mariniflexile sp. KMM 9835]MDQ8211502.1 MBOAT family O-acyltransferase [Mariniflexile sp. KMM 9835]